VSEVPELYPPVQYEWWWLALAVALLVALAAGAWLVWALTRPRRQKPQPIAPLDARLDELRRAHLAMIDDVSRRYAAGELPPREATAELSRVARAFVNDYTGVETPVLSLAELQARGLSPDLIDAVRRHFYPSMYTAGPPIDPVASAEAARRVVRGWH
jgi:hypothetical protein